MAFQPLRFETQIRRFRPETNRMISRRLADKTFGVRSVQESPVNTRHVSIVLPTFNRFSRLKRCIAMIRQNVACPHEVIVVDGGSTDGARDWLREQDDLRVILEPEREGAVKAFNKGFRAAAGHYVMWLNDDAYPLPGSVEAAVAMIERPDLSDVGMVAFYHNWHSERNVLHRVTYGGESYELCHVRGFAYANFGLIRRELLEQVGFADERYYFFAFDPDLSLKLRFEQGLEVIGCREALMHHDEYHDDRKVGDLAAGDEDNAKLFAKWDLPARGAYPDPAPAYRRMLAERGLIEADAAAQ